MSLSGGLGPFLGSAGQRAGAAGQGAAPAGTPVVGAPQRLGPARPRPLHPRAARGGTSVCLDWPLCPLVCGLHRQTPLPFKALVAVVPVRGRLREAVVFPFLHIFPFLSRRLVTLSWALPASLLWRPRCRASGLLACLRAAPFSPPAHSSSLWADVEAGLTSSGSCIPAATEAAFPTPICRPRDEDEPPLLPQARPWSPEVSRPLGLTL